MSPHRDTPNARSILTTAALLLVFGTTAAPRLHAETSSAMPPTLTPTDAPSSLPRLAAVSLKVGDPAPAIDVIGWVADDGVTMHGPGPVRVLFFWSTVCWPCRATIPDLVALARRHVADGVTVAGITSEGVEAVDAFLRTTRWGQMMDFSIAIDRERNSHNIYLAAAGRWVLPTAFIVGRDGIIEWLGSPRDIDEPLAKVVANTWNRADGSAAMERRIAFERLHEELGSEFIEATNAEDWDRVLSLIDRLEAADPSATPAPTERFRVLLVRARRVDEGYAAARDLLRRFPRDAAVLHRTARLILETPDLTPRDTQLALELVFRASEQTLHEHPGYLGTLAAAFEANGRLGEAIQTMGSAINRTESNTVRAALRDVLVEWNRRFALGEQTDAGTVSAIASGSDEDSDCEE